MTTTRFFLTAALLGATACAPPLEADDASLETEDAGPIDADGGPQVDHEDLGDGVTATRVDATADGGWVYLDLSDGQQLEVDDPQANLDWDLAFRRFHIKLNGGASGGGGVEAAIVEDPSFETLSSAPADGYLYDQPDGDDEDDEPDYVLQDWYDYDIMTHVLTPAPVVYVIRHEDGYTKLVLDGYYDDAGTSGHPSFRWASVAPP
ncbi:MAG: HmuY family protein [Nannocystaceae bacterium]